MAGRLVLFLCMQPMEWEIREQQVWQRPSNKTPPSTWRVSRHSGGFIEENRGKRADGVQRGGSDQEQEVD